ncbi:hypothetical protein ABZ721_26265 [Streptomyces sp. NPDC006733]|uniref:hypothetical protein n=1 Tax=Streptomyces sp. NPDC006733 TaxID=3155460 RepID=UPI0033D75CC3
MSVNIDLSLHINDLASAEEADAVEAALEPVLREHSIEKEVSVSVYRSPHWVKVMTDGHPLSISGFARWSPAFERDVADAVRAVAPGADIDLEWGYPDYG